MLGKSLFALSACAALVLVSLVSNEVSGAPESLTLSDQGTSYEACNFTLKIGDRIDYSYSATSSVGFDDWTNPPVGFGVYYLPPLPHNPSPFPGIQQLLHYGITAHGMFTANATGEYVFMFWTSMSTSVVVTYSIHPHESWLSGWALILLGVVAVILVAVVVTLAWKRESGRRSVPPPQSPAPPPGMQ